MRQTRLRSLRHAASLSEFPPPPRTLTLKLEQRQAEFLGSVEGPDPDQVLLERADEALGAAVALRWGPGCAA